MVGPLPAVLRRSPSVARMVLALACSAPRVEPHAAVEPSPRAASPAIGVAPPAPVVQGTLPQRERCDNVGPLACAVPAGSHAALCANVSACVKKALTEDDAYIAELTLRCAVGDGHATESAYSGPSPAPPASGVTSTALLRLMALDQDQFTQFEATFLVADFAQGSCLVDRVHPWDRPSTIADTTFATAWSPTAQGYRLEVRSREVLHEALDSEEREAGESDVRSDHCARITYDVVGRHFRPVARDSTEGSCGDD